MHISPPRVPPSWSTRSPSEHCETSFRAAYLRRVSNDASKRGQTRIAAALTRCPCRPSPPTRLALQPPPRPHDHSHLIRVGGSASADARTVTAGLALVPPKAIHRYTLQLEPGLYRERVTTAGKGPLSLVGLGPAAEVVIIFGCSANNGTGQPGCRPCPPAPGYAGRATLTVGSADFAAVNLTLANDACGYDAGHAAQSEAVSIGADRAAFARCNFFGGQDTLYTGAGPLRSHFADSHINGSCDSIYGDSSSVFERCIVTVVDHVTAVRTHTIHYSKRISTPVRFIPPRPSPHRVHWPNAEAEARPRPLRS